ncbi:MAG TPA: SMC-Scp complex subunit ScpB [Magnetospirillaceae bacterium]|nr:SMC-Scp complex subunit ScpB [Magnetospirillaceae bacterium]
MEASLERDTALLESILFLEHEPQDLASLSRKSGLRKEGVKEALRRLEDALSSPDRGLELVIIGGGWVLAPKRSLWEGLREHYGRRKESRLSRAALETLSIIAYSQPVTRAEIEALRGVGADGMVHILLEKGFIREVGKKDGPGRPVQYGTTKEFLGYFRLESIADLPRLDELDRERFEREEP